MPSCLLLKLSPLLPSLSSSDEDYEEDGGDPSPGSPYVSSVVVGLMDLGYLYRWLAVYYGGVRFSSSRIVPFVSPVPLCCTAWSVDSDARTVWVAPGRVGAVPLVP